MLKFYGTEFLHVSCDLLCMQAWLPFTHCSSRVQKWLAMWSLPQYCSLWLSQWSHFHNWISGITWQNCCDCGQFLSVFFPFDLTKFILKRFFRFLKLNKLQVGVIETGDINHLEEMLYHFSSLLHPNHYIIIDIMHNLVHLYAAKPNLSRPEKERKIQLCVTVLETLVKIDPGFTKWRGTLLQEMIHTVSDGNRIIFPCFIASIVSSIL